MPFLFWSPADFFFSFMCAFADDGALTGWQTIYFGTFNLHFQFIFELIVINDSIIPPDQSLFWCRVSRRQFFCNVFKQWPIFGLAVCDMLLFALNSRCSRRTLTLHKPSTPVERILFLFRTKAVFQVKVRTGSLLSRPVPLHSVHVKHRVLFFTYLGRAAFKNRRIAVGFDADEVFRWCSLVSELYLLSGKHSAMAMVLRMRFNLV